MKKVKITVTATMLVPDKLRVDAKDKTLNHFYWEYDSKQLAYYEPIIAFEAHDVPRDLVDQYDATGGIFEVPKLPTNQGVPRWEYPYKYAGNPFTVTMEEVK